MRSRHDYPHSSECINYAGQLSSQIAALGFGATKEHPKGDAWSEGKETTHWAENNGQTAVIFVVADILKP